MFKKILFAVLTVALVNAQAANVILQNEYVKAGVNETTGTLGSGGNTSPGLLYDSTGSSTFNTSYDYLTPGSPFEGWAVRIVNGGVGTTYHNNNAYVTQVTGGAWVGTPTSSGAVWGVSHSSFDLQHTYSLPSGKQYLDITTQITAKIAMDQLYFARFIDPDARAAAGDSSSTDNVRGYGIIPGTNVVFSEALASRYALGLYTTQSGGVNTSISPMWSSNPVDYYDNTSGHDVVRGDYTIGIAFMSSGLAIGDIVTYNYAYIFGPSAFGAATTAIDGGAGGGTASTTFTGTLTDVGSATDAASAPATPTVTGTTTTTTTATTEAVNTTLPVITASLAHHEASKTSGVQTIARTTTTNVTTPWTRTIVSTPVTTTTYSDSTTTTSTGTSTTTTELFNVVETSVANDSFSGRADQADQFSILRTGLFRSLNRQSAKFGAANEHGRMAINFTGISYNGQNNYNAKSTIAGFAFETDIDKDTVVGFQLNRIGSKLNGSDTSDASLSGTHVGLYADINVQGFTIQNDLGYANVKQKYSRTIGPFSNSFNGKTNATWLSSRVYTPSLEGFKPFVGATVFKENTPTVSESGSIQSAQSVTGTNKTSTSGEVGLAYNTMIEDFNLGMEVARTTTGIKEAALSISKTEDNIQVSLSAGRSWYQNTTSNVFGANLKVRF